MRKLNITKEEYDELTREYKKTGFYREIIYPDNEEFSNYSELGSNIFVLLGISGAGKTTIANTITEKNKDIFHLPRITSREKRKYEGAGEYIFKNKNYFKNNDFFSLKEYASNYYAIDKGLLLNSLKSDRKVILVAGTYEGFILKDVLLPTTLIYIDSDRELANQHIINRDSEVKSGMRRSLQGLDEISKYFSDYIVVNRKNQLDKTIMKIEKIMD